jgi:hypothetical protein
MKSSLLSSASAIALAVGLAAGPSAEAAPLSATKSVQAKLYEAATAGGSREAFGGPANPGQGGGKGHY